MLQISFDPLVDDGFDDDRCHVIIDTGGFRGEARYRNRSPSEFKDLAAELGESPLKRVVQGEWFDGLLRLRIEPVDSLGSLRFQATLADEIDFNSVCVDVRTDYVALEKFAKELVGLIEKNSGVATL